MSLPRWLYGLSEWMICKREQVLEFLEHPIGGILNLEKQQSVFVCETNRYELEKDDFCGQMWQSFNPQFSAIVRSKGIYRLTLPSTEIEALRSLLVKKRYVPAVITPTYEKIAQVVVLRMKKRFYERADQTEPQDKHTL